MIGWLLLSAVVLAVFFFALGLLVGIRRAADQMTDSLLDPKYWTDLEAQCPGACARQVAIIQGRLGALHEPRESMDGLGSTTER